MKKTLKRHDKTKKGTGKMAKIRKDPRELSEKDLEDVKGGATDVFLSLDGIEGESQDDAPKGWIEILSSSPATKK